MLSEFRVWEGFWALWLRYSGSPSRTVEDCFDESSRRPSWTRFRTCFQKVGDHFFRPVGVAGNFADLVNRRDTKVSGPLVAIFGLSEPNCGGPPRRELRASFPDLFSDGFPKVGDHFFRLIGVAENLTNLVNRRDTTSP